MDRNGKKLGRICIPRIFLTGEMGYFVDPSRLVHLRGERYAFIGCTRIVRQIAWIPIVRIFLPFFLGFKILVPRDCF